MINSPAITATGIHQRVLRRGVYPKLGGGGIGKVVWLSCMRTAYKNCLRLREYATILLKVALPLKYTDMLMRRPPSVPEFLLSHFSYDLPQDRIAESPLPERDESKLLVFRQSSGSIDHLSFIDVPRLLPERSLLIVNRTRVIAARLRMIKPSGGTVEMLLTDPIRPLRDPAVVLASHDRSVWRCLIGGRNVLPGMVLKAATMDLRATVLERSGSEAYVELAWDRDASLSQVISEVGLLPLPPYIHRDANAEDEVRYQTVYATEEGSVAAPTAGLHFTEATFSALDALEIERTAVTLHVGLGTFRPVATDDMRDHEMHEERYGFTRSALQTMLRHARSEQPWFTVVGTTSLRTMESVFAFGSRVFRDGVTAFDNADVGQWEAFDTSLNGVTRAEALGSVASWMDYMNIEELWGDTKIMLAPGCRIAMADALITNFHQPGNTLLLLVAAFCGNDSWRDIYNAALAMDYRFLSYGDTSLLIR